MPNLHFLWCHPRSVSTAFERVMRARGDVAVFHEPFMYYHYLHQGARDMPGFTPDPDHPRCFDGIRAMILNRAAERAVFVKDMAYYIVPEVFDRPWPDGASHCMLIRDPLQTILSYARLDPDFTSEELGYQAQWQLYEHLAGQGITPVVLHSDALRQDTRATMAGYWAEVGLPFVEDAFTWDAEVPEGWETVKHWHGSVLQSGGIRPPEERDWAAEFASLPDRFHQMLEHHRPYYEALLNEAIA